MRTYPGIPASSLPPSGSAEFTPRLREMLMTIDLWARDASHAFGRITNGQVPTASGDTISGGGTVDLSQYLYLPGRIGGQKIQNIDTNSTLLTLASTWVPTRYSPFFLVMQDSAGTVWYGVDGGGEVYIGDPSGDCVVYSQAGIYPGPQTTPLGGPFFISLSHVAGVNISDMSGAALQVGAGGNYTNAHVSISGKLLSSQTLPTLNVDCKVGAATIQQWLNGTTVNARMSASGVLSSTGLTVAPNNTSIVPLSITAFTGSSQHLTEWYSSTPTLMGYVSSGGTLTFKDAAFLLQDDGDTTKQLAFQCSGITTGNTRTLTVPDASGTILLDATVGYTGITWTNTQTFSDGTLQLIDPGVTGHVGYIGTVTNLTGTRTWLMPDASGTVMLTTQTTAYSFGLLSNSTTIGASFTDSTTSSKRLRVVLSGATGSNSFTLTNANDLMNFGFQNYGGNVPVVGANTGAAARSKIVKVDATAQSAAIGSTNMTSSATAGYSTVDYTLETTTANVADTSVQFKIGYTDDIGATTQTGGVLSLATQGRDRGSFQVYLASGELSYQTNVVNQSTSRYALHVRVTYLG